MLWFPRSQLCTWCWSMTALGQLSFAAYQYCLASFWRQANIKISLDLGSLLLIVWEQFWFKAFCWFHKMKIVIFTQECECEILFSWFVGSGSLRGSGGHYRSPWLCVLGLTGSTSFLFWFHFSLSSLFLSPPLLSSLSFFYWWRKGLQPPQPPPCLRHCEIASRGWQFGMACSGLMSWNDFLLAWSMPKHASPSELTLMRNIKDSFQMVIMQWDNQADLPNRTWDMPGSKDTSRNLFVLYLL